MEHKYNAPIPSTLPITKDLPESELLASTMNVPAMNIAPELQHLLPPGGLAMLARGFNLTRWQVLTLHLPSLGIGGHPSTASTTSTFRLRWTQLDEWANFGNEVVTYCTQTMPHFDTIAYVGNLESLSEHFIQIRRSEASSEPEVKAMMESLPIYCHNKVANNMYGEPLPTDAHSVIYRNGGNNLVGKVDFVFKSRLGHVTAVMEAKNPWRITPAGIDEVLNGTAALDGGHAARLAVEQVYGYMARNAKVLGVISTMHGWVFLRRHNFGRLEMTRMFPCNQILPGGYYATPGFTILQALYYISYLGELTQDVVEQVRGPGQAVFAANFEMGNANNATAAPVVGAQDYQWQAPVLPDQWQGGQGGFGGWAGSGGGPYQNWSMRAQMFSIELEPWIKENHLGHKTWLARLGPDKRRVVLKVWDSYKEESTPRDNEVDIYLRLNSLWGKCIPNLIGAGPVDFLLCIALQYVDASRLSFENLTDEIELKILDAIDEIHSLGVSHRDIRRDNILVGTNGNVWIIDFEFSSYFPDSGDGKREILLASERKQVETLLHDIKTRKDEKLYGYLQVEQK